MSVRIDRVSFAAALAHKDLTVKRLAELTGVSRERAFDTLEDAQLEAQALEASDTVEYIYPIREVSER